MMKTFFRKALSCLLIAAMLVTAVPAFVFASSGSDEPSIDRSVQRNTINTTVNSSDNNRAEKHASGIADKYYYIMAIHTGTYIGSTLQEIILKYTSEANSSHVRYQVLVPGFTGEIGYFDRYNLSGHYGKGNTIGSLYSTYNNLINSSTTVKGADGKTYEKINFRYGDWAKQLGVQRLGAPLPSAKMNASNVFNSNDTTYLAFETEYDLYELKDVQFYFENHDDRDFSCNGWELYQIPYGNKLGFENYAFFSDSMGLSFTGTMIYRTTDKTNQLISAVGLNTDQYDAINYIFYPIDNINNVPKETPSQRIVDGSGSTIEDYHFFEKCSEAYSSSDKRIMNFVINIADTYEAGLEYLIKSPSGNYNSDGSFNGSRAVDDVLMANIEYVDRGGQTRTLIVPVLSNALMEYAIGNSEEKATEQTRFKWVADGEWISIAQQGESLCFSVEFPSISSLKSVTLDYKNEVHDEDDFIVHSVCVYDNWGDNTIVQRDKYELFDKTSINMAPLGAKLLYESDNSGAIRMSAGGTAYKFRMDYSLDEVFCEERTTNYQGQNVYLVSLTTDSTAKSGTTSDVFVQFVYDALDGRVAQTLEYNLREATTDVMGYNRISVQQKNSAGSFAFTNNGDNSYIYGMSSGKTISFLMSVKNVKTFTAANLRIDETQDEWQMADLKIVKLDELGMRKLTGTAATEKLLIEGESVDAMLNGTYERSYSGETCVNMTGAGVYLINGETRTLDFSSAITTGEKKTRDYSEYENFMDYSTAMGDLMFDSAEKNYEVIVNVASNSTSATTTDDCGSSNLFYFQLVFKSGKRSAYVLANQQLAADGFRSGQKESFTIACNSDMGDVVSINIIPDDTTSENKAMDKLCIDSIEVIKHNAGSVNKRFYAGNVGWISPEYRDTTSMTENTGRTEHELAKNVVITSYGYMLELEFKISYGDYAVQSNGEKYPQFEGNMMAEISYYTTNNEFVTRKNVQLVQAMYEYNGKTPKIDPETKSYCSDTEWMFRERTTDRFLYSVDDISQLVSIKLIGSPNQNTVLPINEVVVSIVQGNGVLKMNTNEEYQMCYESDPILLAEVNDPTPTGKYSFAANAKDGRTFMFCDNTIPSFDEETDIGSVIIPRIPDSAQDTMNLYVYMNPNSPDPGKAGDYTLTSTISYNSSATTNSYKTMTSDFKNLGKDTLNRTVLLAEGLTASNLSVVTNINLSCEHIRRNDIMVDHAVLQQVRNNVVINTYNVAFQSSIIGKSGGVSTGPYTFTDLKSESTKQILTIQLGAGTMEYMLKPETIDIAVALQYTTKAKTANGASSEYTSPYVFATDDPSCLFINAGKILTFTFDEVGVDQITGIKIVAVGGVPATLEAATVICYEADNNNASVATGFFSFEPRPTVDQTSGVRTSNPIELTRDEKTIKYFDEDIIYANTRESADFLRRFDVTFKTMEISEVIDSAGTVPIRMRISYKQHNGNKTTSFKTVADIRDFISKNEGFVAGAETKVSVYLPGLESVYAVEIEPYDDSDTTLCSWNLDTLQYQLNGTEDESVHTIPVKRTVYEDAPLTVNLSTIYVELGYEYADVSGYVVNGETHITAEHGTSITFSPVIYQGTAGYKVVVYKIVADGEMPVQTFGSDAPTFNYKVENNGNETLLYKVVVSSNDNAAAMSTVYITIPTQSESTQSDANLMTQVNVQPDEGTEGTK